MGEYKRSGGSFGKKGGGFRGREDRSNYGTRPSFGARPSFGGGGRSSFGKPSFGRRDDRESGPKEMFRAKCDSCGDSCEVPFRPSGEKPVYCSGCFNKNRPNSEGRLDRGRHEDRARTDRFTKREFTPSGAGAFVRDGRASELHKKIDGLSMKMDRILRLLSDSAQSESPTKERPKKRVDEEAVRQALAKVTVKKDEKKSGKEKKEETKKELAKKTPKKKAGKKSKKEEVARKK